ncbi:glycoside hydrolase superfamily [Plectosphaerella plurivora]|uniref:Glycoside hydrolase superfamily n=1 Tax=Plectosphaerella plurivora TaxID=936078 RepID=A0A9P8V410_9PEZI|nr:glycoside hydrolase superfamily [Plectosphaerella plurivora]
MMRSLLIISVVATASAQGDYKWPAYRELEYATPREIPDKIVTYALPYASLSSLVPNRTTTTWPVEATPTDHDEKFGRAALSSLWKDIPVTTGLITTTVQPTPLPSHELVKPPPLPVYNVKRSCQSFPKNISWGFAGSAMQMEGALKDEGRGPSVWEARSKGQYPGEGGGPPDVAASNYYLYKQDILRLASLGVDSYSFSISWPRIVPFGVAGSPINQEAIDHYDDVINTILEHGMKPVVTLQHFDTPQYFAGSSLTGLGHPEFVEGYLYYAKTVVAHYADRVGTWYSFNEPSIEGNIDFGFGAFDVSASWNYTKNVLDAHATLVRWYRDEVKGSGLWSFKNELSSTGFALPLDPSSPSDVEAALRRNNFNVAMFANPIFLGKNVPESMAAAGYHVYTEEELAFYHGTADFFAFDIYTATFHTAPEGGIEACAQDKNHTLYPKCSVQHRNRTAMWHENFYGEIDRIAVPADAIRPMLGYWHHTYPTKHGITIGEFGLPIYHASHMSIEQHVMDPAQSNFYIPFLRETLKAINYDNVKMKGLFGWAWVDNWEWSQYRDRYGLQVFNNVTMERRFKRGIFDFADFMLKHTSEK